MTERIDLDDLDDASEEEPSRNRGDWLWREEGEPADEPPGDPAAGPGGQSAVDDESPPGREDASEVGTPGGREDAADPRTDRAVPHVPRANKDKPVGIPIEGGGAGGGRTHDGPTGTGSPEATGDGTTRPADADEPAGADGSAGADGPAETCERAASGPHGGDADEMTLALTYEAATRLAHPARAFAEAARWADWVGIVGDVGAPAINKFQRDHGVDVDFFNGSGTGPGERLAEIDRRSMFFAGRMVLVGVEGRDEPIARAADWEFVPLSTAAEEADWELSG